jgi:hypothetical protein
MVLITIRAKGLDRGNELQVFELSKMHTDPYTETGELTVDTELFIRKPSARMLTDLLEEFEMNPKTVLEFDVPYSGLYPVIEFLEQYEGTEATEKEEKDKREAEFDAMKRVTHEMKPWEEKFCARFHHPEYNYPFEQIFNILMTAQYFDFPYMVDVFTQFIANRLKGKTEDQMRKEFGVKDTLTAKQRAEIEEYNLNIKKQADKIRSEL